MNGSRTRTTRAVIAVIIGGLLLVLTACAGSHSAIDASTAQRLSDAVLAVSTASAAGDAARASADLDAVQAELDAAVADDTVSAARAARIQAAIGLVRADLLAAMAPTPTPTNAEEPTAAPTPAPGDSGGKGKDCPPGKHKKGSCD